MFGRFGQVQRANQGQQGNGETVNEAVDENLHEAGKVRWDNKVRRTAEFLPIIRAICDSKSSQYGIWRFHHSCMSGILLSQLSR